MLTFEQTARGYSRVKEGRQAAVSSTPLFMYTSAYTHMPVHLQTYQKLLFGLPLWAGCLITGLDTFTFLAVHYCGVRYLCLTHPRSLNLQEGHKLRMFQSGKPWSLTLLRENPKNSIGISIQPDSFNLTIQTTVSCTI